MLGAIGPLGVCGVGVLLFCVPFYLTTLAPAEGELERRSAELKQGPARPAMTDGAAELEQFFARFPRIDRLEEELGALYAFAEAANVRLAQGEYRMESRSGPLLAYQVSLPMRASYPQLRQFVGDVLEKMPTTSLDALSFDRRKAADAEVEAHMKLTIYLRPRPERKGI